MLEKAVACRSDDEVRVSDVSSHLAAIQRRIRSHLPKLMKHLWVVEVYCEGAGSTGTQLTRSGPVDPDEVPAAANNPPEAAARWLL